MSPKELQDYLLDNWELLGRGHGVFCSCCGGRVIDAHIIDGAVLLSVARNIEDRLTELDIENKKLETENARLKKQCEHLACDVVSAAQDYSAPMSDCRTCDYDRFCRRKPGQVSQACIVPEK